MSDEGKDIIINPASAVDEQHRAQIIIPKRVWLDAKKKCLDTEELTGDRVYISDIVRVLMGLWVYSDMTIHEIVDTVQAEQV